MPRLLRWAIFACLTAVIGGCGSSTAVKGVAAEVGNTRISDRTLRQSVQYAHSYYQVGSGVANCRPASGPCTRLRQPVLRRLLEEAIVKQYAREHRIVLTAQDRRAVTAAVDQLTVRGTATARLIDQNVVTTKFLRDLVSTEILVRKVEALVTGAAKLRGFQYHIVLYHIPAAGDPHHGPIYHQALTLATDGKPSPPGTRSRHEWVVPGRLPRRLRVALGLAGSGQYVGPVRHNGQYLVAELLGSGRRLLSTPARVVRETALFRDWIASALRAALPRCYSVEGKISPCPAPEH